MKARGITAGELLAKLEADPAWVERRNADERKREKLRADFAALERPILNDLRAIGVNVQSLGDARFFEQFPPLPSKVVDLFLRSLPTAPLRLKEPIVRLLAASSVRFPGQELAKMFDQTLQCNLDELELQDALDTNSLRWAIGLTIAEARPYGVEDWVFKTVKNPLLGRSKEMLLIAMARLIDPKTANETLIELFEQFPVHCAVAMGEIGGLPEREFLTGHLKDQKGETKEEIKQAIKAIDVRVAKAGR